MLTASERAVLREVQAWRTRTPNWMGRQVKRINQPLKRLSGLMHKVPGVDYTLDHLVAGVIKVATDVAQDSVSRKGVLDRYCTRGYSIQSVGEVRNVDMDTINIVLGELQVRYQTITGAQGAALGLTGLVGLLPDLVGLVGFNLRAACEIATCCGFDVSEERERNYAVYTLNVAAGAENGAIGNAAGEVARYHTRQTAEQLAVKGTIYGLARALGRRLISLKMAQIVPVAGMVVGGGSNAWYTARVCEAARNLYRERLIHSRYPAPVIAMFD